MAVKTNKKKVPKEVEAQVRIHATVKCYQRTFESEDGYKVLIDLMRHFNMMQPSFTGENPLDMAFREGGRNAVLYIMKKCKMSVVDLETIIEGAEK